MDRRHFLFALQTLALPNLMVGAFENIALAEGTLPPEENKDIKSRYNFNENPIGLPAASIKSIKEEATATFSYAYHKTITGKLKKSLQTAHGVDAEYINLMPGSREGIRRILGDQKRFQRTFHSSNHEYEKAVEAAREFGYQMNSVSVNKTFGVDLESFQNVKSGVVYFSNPHLPFGGFYDPSILQAFIKKLPKEVLVIVDECYIQFTGDQWESRSAVPLTKVFKNLFVLRTFSKIYGMSGLRVGYTVSHPDLNRPLFTSAENDDLKINSIGALAAIAGLGDKLHALSSIQNNDKLKLTIEKFCAEKGIEYTHSRGNYVCFFANSKEHIKRLQQKMSPFHISTNVQRGTYYAKISLKEEKHLKTFLEAFESSQ